MVDVYGPVFVGGRLLLKAPVARDDRFDYADELAHVHKFCGAVSMDLPVDDRPRFHPKPGGLLVWGSTTFSEHLFWDTGASDDPEHWPVVVHQQRALNQGENPWFDLEMPFEEALTAIVRTGVRFPDTTLGPLAPTVERSLDYLKARSWGVPPPPEPKPAPDPRRLAAFTQGTGLDALCELVPPPEAPYLGEGSWEELFERLGTRLPTEFVALTERYGYGYFADWLHVPAPLRSDHRGLAKSVEESLYNYRDLRNDAPDYQPLAVWPEPGGFLPVLETQGGDEIGWLTLGEPDEWPVIVYPRHNDQGPPLTGLLTDLILEWLRGNFTTDGFVRLFVDEADPFETIRFEGVSPAPEQA
ncbi:SMI1/KNR4 family protein [Amycolatopsis alba]|uniref:SMI1/KNR4 family protein n=1 Tax=Amycolatopsis alba TaxID=76020 RepID=UPI001177703D|nr:SMI1/KNR4 family protein [Amycolatopsis alba]